MRFKNWLILTEAKKPYDLAFELIGDEGILKSLKGILPTQIKAEESNRYLLIAAYFYRSQRDLATLRADLELYARLVARNKMKLFTFDDKGNLNPQFHMYANYLEWTAAMHGMQGEEQNKAAAAYRPSEGDFLSLQPIFINKNESIKVFKARNVNDAIILGRGTTFCISQPGNTMYKSYRDQHGATFYFVFDSNRNDDLNIVVVDVSEDDDIYLTDRMNRTGTCQNPENSTLRDNNAQVYLNYLQKNGVNLSIFENDPVTREEEAENLLLGRYRDDFEWFVRLTPAQKSAYIGRGHSLTDEQFSFLVKHKLRSLLEQYVSVGRQMPEDLQLDYVLSDKELGKKYMHFQLIALEQQGEPIREEEFNFVKENMKDKYAQLINLILNIVDQTPFHQSNPKLGYIKNLITNDETLTDEIMKRIRKKLDLTLGKKDREHGLFYKIPLGQEEMEILRREDRDMYKKVLIQNSHAGYAITDDEIKDLSKNEFDELHSHSKMNRSIEDDDEENFKNHYNDFSISGLSRGMNHRQIKLDHGAYDYTSEWVASPAVQIALNGIDQGKLWIADHIIDSKIKTKTDKDLQELRELLDMLKERENLAIFLKYLKKLSDEHIINLEEFADNIIRSHSIRLLNKLRKFSNEASKQESLEYLPLLTTIRDIIESQNRKSSKQKIKRAWYEPPTSSMGAKEFNLIVQNLERKVYETDVEDDLEVKRRGRIDWQNTKFSKERWKKNNGQINSLRSSNNKKTG